MKLKFKHQKFQADAAKAVVDVFKGQPYLTAKYLKDIGEGNIQTTLNDDFIGWSNHKILPEISRDMILDNIRIIQRENGIEQSDKLEGLYNLTIEMETGDCVIIVTGCKYVDNIRFSETFNKYETLCVA